MSLNVENTFRAKNTLEIFRAQTSVSIFLGLELMQGPENIHSIANLSSTNILDMDPLGQKSEPKITIDLL